MITQSKDELATSEESRLLGNYMNKVEPPYEAQLNFQYSLSADQEENYISEVANAKSHAEIWQTITYSKLRINSYNLLVKKRASECLYY